MLCSAAPGRAGRFTERGRRRGQVLLIAVMLMTAILLLGALFVAIVNYNQYQSTRHGDVLLARALAEAGIRYADYMLRHSPLGADWRPPQPPMYDIHTNTYDPGFNQYYLPEEIARGYHGIRDSGQGTIIRIGFTRYPDPVGSASSPSADLPDIGWDQGHILLRVTYDPDPPFEPSDAANTPDPMSKYIKIEAVGVVMGRAAIMHKLVAYKPIGLTDYLLWVTDKTSTGRPAYVGLQPYIDFDNSGTVDTDPNAADIHEAGEFLVTDYEGPIRINTHLQLIGGNLSGNPLSGAVLDPARASNQFILTTTPVPPGGYLRDDRIEVTDGISDPVQGAPGTAPVPGQSSAVSEVHWSGGAIATNPPQTIWPSDDPRYTTVGGLVLDGAETQDASGQSRFVKRLAAPDAFEADPLTGVDRYRALTRDSGPLVTLSGGDRVYAGSLGHGPPDGGMYIDNFDDLQFVQSDGTHDLESLIQDWLQQIPEGDPRASQSGWNALGTLYVPPGVEIELCDSEDMARQGRTIVDSRTNPPTSPDEVWWPGHVSGEPGIRLIRHDKHWQCIDGTDSGLNEMVIDYPRWPHAVIFAEGNVRIRGVLPRARRNLDGTLARDYNLVVVSGGTIYIDGQILSPKDVDATVPDEDDTKIALIARDHVCLNTTMIVAQNKSGLVAVAPDDPANPDPDHMHWDLAPGAGYLWSSWTFGSTPAGQVVMHVQHTGADPGPSGVGMNTRDPVTGFMRPFDFGGGYYVYKLVPPGVPFLGPGANVIAPLWETAHWDLTPVIATTPGQYNALAFFHRDPGIAPGSTDYWVKKWKLQEWVTVGGQVRPTGSVHARINAVVYAQRGCWFVIPGTYYDPDAQAADNDGDGVPDSVAFRRYNYEITFRGSITENYTPPPEAVQDWMDKWAFPFWTAPDTVCWASIRYVYDETLRAGRDQPPATLVANVRRSSGDPRSVLWNLPRLPLLPVSPDLIYFGQAW